MVDSKFSSKTLSGSDLSKISLETNYSRRKTFMFCGQLAKTMFVFLSSFFSLMQNRHCTFGYSRHEQKYSKIRSQIIHRIDVAFNMETTRLFSFQPQNLLPNVHFVPLCVFMMKGVFFRLISNYCKYIRQLIRKVGGEFTTCCYF